jgi:hypothetical protein
MAPPRCAVGSRIDRLIIRCLPLALLILILGCAQQPQTNQAAKPAISAAAAGLGFAVEYIKPEDFRDPGNKTRTFFPVKFVCGEAKTGDPLAPAVYTTSINVVSLTKFQTKIGWQFIVVPKTIVGAPLLLRSYGMVEMDCQFIVTNLVLGGVNVGPFVEGFLLIEALDRTTVRVVAVYSALHKPSAANWSMRCDRRPAVDSIFARPMPALYPPPGRPLRVSPWSGTSMIRSSGSTRRSCGITISRSRP